MIGTWLLALAASTSPVGELAGAATMACVGHVFGVSPLSDSDASSLPSAAEPPEGLKRNVQEGIPQSWGTPFFTKAENAQVTAWAIGFSGGNCLLDAKGNDFEKLRSEVLSAFGTGTPWQKLAPSADASERYGVSVTPPGEETRQIVANVISSSSSDGGRMVVTFELAQ